MKFKEWVNLLSPPKDYKQFAGSDLLDSIVLIVIYINWTDFPKKSYAVTDPLVKIGVEE